ncbi:proteasome activator subunit 4-like [Camellia sinensis]|uniref:proteasome activator subunit 4-like n=1 Tax=Camellia sinensis TaxID=4442 RepID=UPI001036A8D5|nr:proteasome activator subunit 4-like [Camellia sinensis]
MKGGDENLAEDFRGRAYRDANAIQKKRRQRNSSSGLSIASIHGAVLALAACVLSVPYDMPSWLPEHVTLLAHFVGESSPAKSTVTKAVAEFQRTHADTWNIQKNSFTEDQLEVLKLHLDHSGTQGHRRGSQSGGVEYAQSDVWASAYSALAAGVALIAILSMLAYLRRNGN